MRALQGQAQLVQVIHDVFLHRDTLLSFITLKEVLNLSMVNRFMNEMLC